MEFEPVIGLEIHAELATESKLFCGCSTKFGTSPNSQVCPVCLGLPGVLPVVNEKALEYMIRIALALNSTINKVTKFDRKNYYYPDLPKNYQISQQYLPFAKDGWVEIKVDGEKKRIGIGNIHLEEDAGKNIHPKEEPYSLVDLNRAGIPLVEIVTKPEMRNLKEVEVFMNTLQDMLLYIGASDCKMEEGSLRFEANISMRRKGDNTLPPRSEIKNLNSFKMVIEALEYEVKRQVETLKEGEKVLQETRLWDEEHKRTHSMRSKEEAQDYRYFPEPDLPPFFVTDEEIEKVRKTLPELPHKRKERFITQYNLKESDSTIILSSKEIADFFEKCIKEFQEPKEVANWIMGPVMRYLNEKNVALSETKLLPEHLKSLLNLIKNGSINKNTAKNILTEIIKRGSSPEEIVKEKELLQLTDEKGLSQLVEKVIEENQKAVGDFKKGEKKAIGFLIGQVMKLSKGKADPNLVNKLLNKKLKS